jgi:hypothetical protein
MKFASKLTNNVLDRFRLRAYRDVMKEWIAFRDSSRVNDKLWLQAVYQHELCKMRRLRSYFNSLLDNCKFEMNKKYKFKRVLIR